MNHTQTSPRVTTIGLTVALALALNGCRSSNQVVRFDSPTKPDVRVTRSLFAKGPNSGMLPFHVQVKRGRVYRTRFQFDERALKAIGYTDAEIAILEETGSTTLEGGLVCPEIPQQADRNAPTMLLLTPADLRAALEQGKGVLVSSRDAQGNLRAVFKASAEGVSLGDPELASHGTPISTTLLVIGDVGVIVGIVTAAVGAVLLACAIVIGKVVSGAS